MQYRLQERKAIYNKYLIHTYNVTKTTKLIMCVLNFACSKFENRLILIINCD